MREIKFFNSSLEKFIQNLETETIAKVLRVAELSEIFGHNLGLPHSKKISKNLFELRIDGKQNIRIFYTFHKAQIILLHGFVKKSQKIPLRDLKIAIRRIKQLESI